MRDRLKKYWNLLLWLGLFLSVAGLTSGAVSGSWTPVPTILIIVGVVILGIWLIYLEQFQSGFWTRRSTEAGTNAIFATVAMLMILGIFNFLAVRASVRIDLTETQRFTLAPQTQALLKSLEQPAKVWLFSPQADDTNQTLLENFDRIAPENFDYEYIDPQANPGLVQQFNVTQVGDVFLEVGEQRQYVQTVGVEPLTEAQLTQSLAKIVGGDRLTVYFLQGHGEPPLLPGGEASISKAVRALEETTAVAEPLNLIEAGSVPDDADVVVIAGPTSQLFDPEIEALENYLQAGGGVLALIDPNTDPGLSAFLDNWGLTLDDRIAVDPERWVQGFGPAAPLVIDYGQHPITEDFGQNYSLYPVVRPIQYDTVEDIEISPLLFTSNASWAESDIEEGPDWELNPESDRPGPLVLAVAASQPITSISESSPSPTPAPTPTPETPENGETPQTEPEAVETPVEPSPEATANPENTESDSTLEARLAVVGDSDFMTDAFFDGQLNGDFFLNTVQWLSQGETETLSIRPREAVDRDLVMTPRVARLLSWTALLTFPVLGFAASAILWWTRR